MAYDLDKAFDSSSDIVLHNKDGKTQIIWFVDYADETTRKVGDVIANFSDRLVEQDALLAVRLISTSQSGALASRAAIAAHMQGKFADMHDVLILQPMHFSSEGLAQLAQDLGLDLERFQSDMYSHRTEEALINYAASFDASSIAQTPAIFINNRAYDAAWDEHSLLEAIHRPIGMQLTQATKEFTDWAASAGLVLILTTLASIFIYNAGFSEQYDHIILSKLGLNWEDWSLQLSFEHWINDGLMAIFFLLVGIEIKREFVSGELNSIEKAALPIVGAIGGMVAPALLYLFFNLGTDTAHGWGVPMATDIAFTLGILALLGSRVPASLKVFISALAIADDLGAIMVIALFYSHGIASGPLLYAAITFAILAMLNRSRVYAITPYLLVGLVLWYFVLQSGVHATLAGVIVALMIPARPPTNARGFALHVRQVMDADIVHDRQELGVSVMQRLKHAVDRLREPGFHLQHALENWSSFLILPLFAFANTGVSLSGDGFSLSHPTSLGIIAGLVIGKPLGITLAVWLAVQTKKTQLSEDISWMQLLGATAICGVGFTMSLFIASEAFDGDQLASAKVSTLVASGLAALIGTIIFIVASREGHVKGTGA